MDRTCQKEAASIFVQMHEQEVQRIEAALLEAADLLMSNVGSRILEPSVMREVKDCCERRDLSGVFSVIRSRASDFVRASQSEMYWEWVDGAGFFFDATGSRWPYMTEDGRARALGWADKHAITVLGAEHASTL